MQKAKIKMKMKKCKMSFWILYFVSTQALWRILWFVIILQDSCVVLQRCRMTAFCSFWFLTFIFWLFIFVCNLVLVIFYCLRSTTNYFIIRLQRCFETSFKRSVSAKRAYNKVLIKDKVLIIFQILNSKF